MDLVGVTRKVVGDCHMSRSTYFVQECPTCGRNLQVRVQYLGKQVLCKHCGARLESYDPGTASYPPPPSTISLLVRADQLIQTDSASQLGMPGVTSDVMPVLPK